MKDEFKKMKDLLFIKQLGLQLSRIFYEESNKTQRKEIVIQNIRISIFEISKQKKEANQEQILIYLDFILQSILKCLKTNPEMMKNLKQLQKYYRCISCRETYQ